MFDRMEGAILQNSGGQKGKEASITKKKDKGEYRANLVDGGKLSKEGS